MFKSYVTHLNDDVGGEPGILTDSKKANLIQNIQAHIHANVDTLTKSLAKAQDEIGAAANRCAQAGNTGDPLWSKSHPWNPDQTKLLVIERSII